MKRIIAVFLSIIMLTAIIAPISVGALTPDFNVESEVALLISLDTGDVIYDKSADEKREPAALTAIMVAALCMENCDNLDETITVDGDICDTLLGTGYVIGNLKDEETVSIRTLVNMVMIRSAADAALILADHFGNGDIDAFVKMMNDKAKELGADSTNFANVIGMHDEDHYTTAYDMAKISQFAMDIPGFMDICSATRYTVPASNKNEEWTFSTTNYLIDYITSYYYKYASGIKTGYTDEAGRCIVSTASYSGYNYMCVIMGGSDRNAAGEVSRTELVDSKELYRWAFNNFEYKQICSVNTVVAEMPVELCWDTDYVSLYPEKNFSAIIPSGMDVDSIIFEPVLKEESVWAPVNKGDILGYVSIICEDREIGQVNLVAGDTLKRNPIMFIGKLGSIILSSLVFRILAVALVVMLIAAIILNIVHNKRKRRHIKRVKPMRKL